MTQELLGGEARTGLLDILHEEHEEAATLLDRIIEAEEPKDRQEAFAELKEKLTLHLRAESKVLYAKLEKDEGGHEFALEGEIEHDLVIQQLDELARSRNKSADAWLARVKVVKDLVQHHVEEEEGEGWSHAREMFDEEQLEKLAGEFEREKERLMGGGRSAGRRRTASASAAHAGDKPRARAGARRKTARRRAKD